jgi:hypothetical protein
VQAELEKWNSEKETLDSYYKSKWGWGMKILVAYDQVQEKTQVEEQLRQVV